MSVLLQGVRSTLTLSAAGATQDFTFSGMGTPVAAIFYVSIATADNTVSNGAIESIGWTDGTHHECWSICNQNVGLGNTNNKVRADNAKVIYMLTAAGASTGIASFNSWITDGVRITVDTQFSAAYKIGVLLIGGSEALANAGNFSGPGPGGTRVVTGVGFSPDLIFFLGTKTFNASNTDIGSGMLGIAIPGGGITQRGLNWACADNSGTSDDYLCLDSAVGMLGTSANARDPFVNVTAFGSDGFTLTEIVGNNTGPAQAYLALKLPNCPIYLDYVTTPTATGNTDFTGPGFQPRFAAFLGCQATSTAATKTNTEASAFGLGWVAGAGTPVEHSMSCEQKDNVTSQITRSVVDTCAMTLLSDASTVSHKAVWNSWLSTGIRLGFNPTDGLTARKWAMLAIGPTTLTPDVLAQTITTFAPVLQTIVIPGTASLTSTKFAPVIVTAIIPPVASLALTTFAPATFLIPATAALVTQTFAPILQTVVIPGTATVTLSTFAPATMPIPTQASLVTNTFAPVLQTVVIPGTAALVITPFDVSLGGVVPNTAALTITTFAPTLQETLTTGAATLTLTTFPPILNPIPDPASLTLTTFAPSLATIVIPGTASLSLAGLAPVLETRVTPGVAALATSTFAPTLQTALIPGTAALAISGQPPFLDEIPATAALVITTYAPSIAITANGTVIPGNATLSITTFAPVLVLTVTPGTANLTLTPLAPSLPTVVSPGTANISIATFAPALQETLIPGTANLSVAGFAPVLVEITTPGVAVLVTTTFPPDIVANDNRTSIPDTLGLIVTTFPPIVDVGGNFTAIPANLTLVLTTHAPGVGGARMNIRGTASIRTGISASANVRREVIGTAKVARSVSGVARRQD